MPEQLRARIEACYQQAETFFGRTFPRPESRLDLRGLSAGSACPARNRLRFNPQLYRENREDFLQQTVAHEVAHLLASQLAGPHIRPHGPEWQQLMQQVFGLPARRCHPYPVKRPPRLQHIYTCQCPEREFAFSARRHALAGQGYRYQCPECRTVLDYSGRQRLE